MGGRGNIYIFFIIRYRNFKHKFEYFHIFQRYLKKIYISLKTSVETNSSTNLTEFLLIDYFHFFVACLQSLEI